MELLKYPWTDPLSPGTIVMVSGSVSRTGPWIPSDYFHEMVVQAYSTSGTGSGMTNGTFSGTITIEGTLEKSSLATPETLETMTAGGMKQITERTALIRAKVTPWAGTNYVVLLRGYRRP